MSAISTPGVNATKLLAHGLKLLPSKMIDMENRIFLQMLKSVTEDDKFPLSIKNSVIGEGQSTRPKPKTKSRAKKFKQNREARKKKEKYIKDLEEKKITLETEIEQLLQQLERGPELSLVQGRVPLPLQNAYIEVTEEALASVLDPRTASRSAQPVAGIRGEISNLGENTASIVVNHGVITLSVQNFLRSNPQGRQNIIAKVKKDVSEGTTEEKLAANMFMSELLDRPSDPTDNPISPEDMEDLQSLIQTGKIDSEEGRDRIRQLAHGFGVNQIMKLAATGFLVWAGVTGLTIAMTSDLYDPHVSGVNEAARDICFANESFVDESQGFNISDTDEASFLDWSQTALGQTAEASVAFAQGFLMNGNISSSAVAPLAMLSLGQGFLGTLSQKASTVISQIRQAATDQFGTGNTSIQPFGNYNFDFDFNYSQFIRENMLETVEAYQRNRQGLTLPNLNSNSDVQMLWEEVLLPGLIGGDTELSGIMNFLQSTVPPFSAPSVTETALAIYNPGRDYAPGILDNIDFIYTVGKDGFVQEFKNMYHDRMIKLFTKGNAPSDETVQNNMLQFYDMIDGVNPVVTAAQSQSQLQRAAGPRFANWFEQCAAYPPQNVPFNHKLAFELAKTPYEHLAQGTGAIREFYLNLPVPEGAPPAGATPKMTDAIVSKNLARLSEDNEYLYICDMIRGWCGMSKLSPYATPTGGNTADWSLDNLGDMIKDVNIGEPQSGGSLPSLEEWKAVAALKIQRPFMENHLGFFSETPPLDVSTETIQKYTENLEKCIELSDQCLDGQPHPWYQLEASMSKDVASRMPSEQLMCNLLAFPNATDITRGNLSNYVSGYAIGGGNDCGCGYEEEDECSVDVGVAGYAF